MDRSAVEVARHFKTSESRVRTIVEKEMCEATVATIRRKTLHL